MRRRSSDHRVVSIAAVVGGTARCLTSAAASALVLLALVGVALTGCAAAAQEAAPTARPFPDAAIALTVDGQDVPVRELRIYLLRERSAELSSATQAAKDPGRAIIAAASHDVAEAVLQFQLAARNDILSDPSYATFLGSLDGENRRRADAVAAHQPVYGPQQYSESGYLDYVLGEIRFELPPRLGAEGAFAIDSRSIDEWVESHHALFLDQSDAYRAPGADDARLAYLDAQYTSFIEQTASRATISWTATGTRLMQSGCAVAGTC